MSNNNRTNYLSRMNNPENRGLNRSISTTINNNSNINSFNYAPNTNNSSVLKFSGRNYRNLDPIKKPSVIKKDINQSTNLQSVSKLVDGCQNSNKCNKTPTITSYMSTFKDLGKSLKSLLDLNKNSSNSNLSIINR